MAEYVAANGTVFTDEDIERWAAVDESEEGYTGGYLGRPRRGRPLLVGEMARPFTVRLDAVRRAKIDAVAKQRNTTASQLVRDWIDELAA
jgi:hypothetical protein